MVNDTRPIPHGTNNGYENHKCRCELCKDASKAYRRQRRESGPVPKPTIQHGTRSGYNSYKCRCEECKAANKEYNLCKQQESEQDPSSVPHGTRSGYSYYGCRCDECTAASKAYSRKRYDLKPRKPPREPMPIPHGTKAGYGHHKCRCDQCKAAARSDERQRREENPERYRDYRKRSYEANREKIAEYNRRRRADPRYRRLKCDAEQRRKARKHGAFFEDVPRLEIFERDNWQCQISGCLYPGIPVKLDGRRIDPLYANVDHIIPLAKGGRHERSNLATAHFRCNCVKKDRIGGIA